MRHDRHLRAEAFCADFTPAAALHSLERNPRSWIGGILEPCVKEFASALYRGTQVLLLAAGLATASTQRAFAQTSLLNVSYDPTRELYAEINPLFAADWKKKSPVRISPSGE
jgi:hypothetical protein